MRWPCARIRSSPSPASSSASSRRFPRSTASQTPTLREKYGFTDEEVEFFDLHIVSDEIHGERGYQIVLEHARTLELQARCLKICEVGAQMRLLYTTALFNDYVKAQGPDAIAA